MSGLLPRTTGPSSSGTFTDLQAQTLVVTGTGFISNLTTAVFSAGQLETTDLSSATSLTISTGGSPRIVIPQAGISLDNTVTNILALSGTNLVYCNDLVDLTSTQTLTNKTLTAPIIATISNTGTLTLPTSTDTLVGRATTDTLTNKTLTAPIIATISNTGTLTLPTSTDTLVARATTDTLENKTLLTATCKFADSATNPKAILFDSPSATANTSTTFRTAQSVDRVITFPNATDTVVLAAATQSLTNKTLTSPVITNGGTLTLPTVNTTLVGRDTTDTLTNKTLTLPIFDQISNGAALLTLPTTSDTLVGRATTDTLTNKTLTAPAINLATFYSGKVIQTTGTQSTTDGSTVTLVTVPVATSNSVASIKVLLVAYCTAGANANTACNQRVIFKVTNVAGTLSQATASNVFSNAFATNLALSLSGTNALVQVVGIASNDITWVAYVETSYI